MRVKKCVLSVLLLSMFPVLARAVTIRVQDPNYSNVTTPTSFYFGSCQGYLNNAAPVTDSGCFAGQNQTGSPITSITLNFDSNQALNQAGGAVAAIGRGDLFASSSTTTTTNPLAYTLNFTNGAIANNVFFLVTEDGLDHDLFPEVSLSYTNVTPEPPSVLLIATGLMGLGLVYRRYRLA